MYTWEQLFLKDNEASQYDYDYCKDSDSLIGKIINEDNQNNPNIQNIHSCLTMKNEEIRCLKNDHSYSKENKELISQKEVKDLTFQHKGQYEGKKSTSQDEGEKSTSQDEGKKSTFLDEDTKSNFPEENKKLTFPDEGKNTKIRFTSKKTQRENFESKEKKHDKYATDNMLKKIKISFVNKNGIINYINSEIKRDNELFKILGNRLLLGINTNELIKPNVQYNKDLIKTKLKDILYVEVMEKYGMDMKYNNRELIDKIYSCKEGKKITDILEKTFLECLRYYRKDKEYINNIKYSCLNGLQNQFDNLIEKLKEKHEEKYVNEFIDFIKNYENFIEKRIPKDKK